MDDFKPDKIEAFGAKMFYEEDNTMPFLNLLNQSKICQYTYPEFMFIFIVNLLLLTSF
jgi:hypothetical protein